MKFINTIRIFTKIQALLLISLFIINVKTLRKLDQHDVGSGVANTVTKQPQLPQKLDDSKKISNEINKAISSASIPDISETIKGIIKSTGINNTSYEAIKSIAIPGKQKPLQSKTKKTNLGQSDGSESMEIPNETPNTSDVTDGNITPPNNADVDTTNVETREEAAVGEQTNKKIKKLKVNWYNTKLKAQDIGINSQGDLYVVDIRGKLYKYEFLTDSFTHLQGDFELTKIKRVDASWDGMPYVITETGDTYYLNCEYKWTRLPGCASDIGIGRGGEIYKIGCDTRGDGGFGIYRLYCSCPSTCCYKGCQNWKKPFKFIWEHKPDERTCEWFRIEGNGYKIDVAPSGNPYIIEYNGDISQYDGTNWRKIPTLAKAYDLTVSNEGVLFFISQDANIYKLADEAKAKWIQLSGQAEAITAGPFTQPWVIRRIDKSVLGSAKFDYN